VGILTMVGLSTMMDHCGMTQLLAQGLSQATGSIFPVVSPLVGMLGTFTTGSNNNSNVLLAPLQKNVANLLHLDPRILVSSQTAGGSVGSMIAPAKIVVGCSTVGILGKDGLVLRRTLPYGLAIGLGIGIVTWLMVLAPF
jgi:lactate permease